MKVSWHRQANRQLNIPPVCAVTGQPAAGPLPTLFRNRMSYWLPGLGRMIMTLSNPPIMVNVPLSADVRQRVTTWRLVGLVGPLGGVVLGLICAFAVRDVIGSLLAFVLIAASIALAIFARLRANPFGGDVSGDQISMTSVHPAFADAFARSNPAGLIGVEGMPVPMSGYPQPYGGFSS